MEGERQIVVIDDDQDVINSVEFILNVQKIKVIGFKDGHEAISFIRNQNYSGVIVCDAQMPTMSGWDLVAMLVEQNLHQRLVINMLTAIAQPPESSHRWSPYIHDYVIKPFTKKHLIDVVEHSFKVLQGEV